MTATRRFSAVSLSLARAEGDPWWWRHIDRQKLPFDFTYVPVVLPKGRPHSVLSRRFWFMCSKIVRALFRARREHHDYIFTTECDWTSFIVAGVQTLLRLRRPRHVILQFIMREKNDSLGSRIKYAFMKWCFSSVDRIVCSARPECDYYARVFAWRRDKLAFVPFTANPDLLSELPEESAPAYAVSAGRSFRDYPTLLKAFDGVSLPLTIVGAKNSLSGEVIPKNVTVLYELPLDELNALIAGSAIVILPLEDRQISIGQSVLLQAMSMGKAIVVTRVNGTVDYVEHMKTAMLVPPRDPVAIRAAVERLQNDADLRRRLGLAARRRVELEYLPKHYMQGVFTVLERRPGKASD